MLPLIIAAGVVGSTAAAIYTAKSSCYVCDSKLTWNENCLICNKEICGSCGQDSEKVNYKNWSVSPSGRCCVEHKEKLNSEIDTLKKAIDDSEEVEVYSKNFKGKVPHSKKSKIISTKFHADKDDAERELKILAAMEGCSSVTNVSFHKKAENDGGNYYYSVWQYEGQI